MHPDLTVTETGCHVWPGAPPVPCFVHGTAGCCLIMHRSPASQRAHDQPRCAVCKRFLPSRDPYATSCHRIDCEEP